MKDFTTIVNNANAMFLLFAIAFLLVYILYNQISRKEKKKQKI